MAAPYASAAEISTLVGNVNSAAKEFEGASEREAEDARRKLQIQAAKLLYSLEEPNTEVWPRIYQVCFLITYLRGILLVWNLLMGI